MRHGKADQLPGADTDDTVDGQRVHTAEGQKQVYEGGRRAARDLGIENSQVILIKRASPRKRAIQTAEDGSRGLLEELREEGIEPQLVTIQKSTVPAYKDRPAQSRMTREFLDVKTPTRAYTAAKVRKGKGVQEMGAGRSVSEEWTRHPEILQQDLNESGFGSLSAEQTVGNMKDTFQNSVAVADRATSMLAAKWQARNKENPDTKPPRLVILEGSHGFVSEPWLMELLKNYEKQTGEPITLEMEYGDFWRVHWSADPNQQPTLHIGGKAIPVEEKFLKKLQT